jgi:glycosyltransferase involved in cell wall biosynthesis
VLAPHAAGLADSEVMDGVLVHRFRYAPQRFELLAYDGGILSRLRSNRAYLLLVPFFLFAEALAIRRLHRRYGFAVIHAHWIIPQGLTAGLAFLESGRRPPMLCTSHGADLFGLRGRLAAAIKAWVLHRCAAITVVSHVMAREVRRLVPGAAPSTIPMGTDLEHIFTPDESVHRDPNRLLFVGRLVEKKGVDHLLRAFAVLHAKHPALGLTIAGYGPEEARLRDLCTELGIERTVAFLGPVRQADLPHLYRQAAITVVPSIVAADGDQEGFGLVIVEAIGCGCPVVASDLPAIRYGSSQEGGVTLVSPGNSTALASAIEATLNDPVTTRHNTTQTRERLNQSFSSNAVARAYSDLLKRLINEAPRAAESLRRSHASLNLGSRTGKARKIAALLQLDKRSGPLRLLEVGTGSGGIAHYFGNAANPLCEVDAVDVVDQRQVHGGYRFTCVKDEHLPFPDAHFDVVISNHVIEHVGNENAQRNHLTELRRVLKPSGVGYLATPSRWMPVEPHYRLAFLSWLPEGWRTPYLRLRKRGQEYDCRPLTVRALEQLLRDTGFKFQQQHGRALRLNYEIENPSSLAYRAIFRNIPDTAYGMLRRIFPTLIYLLDADDDHVNSGNKTCRS